MGFKRLSYIFVCVFISKNYLANNFKQYKIISVICDLNASETERETDMW